MIDVLIYGATGYTGRLVVAQAKKTSLNFGIGGRNDKKLKELAMTLGVPSFVFDVNDSSRISTLLRNTKILLNCAGPFKDTAVPLIDACIRNGVHYLDVAVELNGYHHANKRDEEAKRAGIMLMPGAGGTVAMFGCLAARVLERVQNIQYIDIAIAVAGPMSRGSVISASEDGANTLHRSAGILESAISSDLVSFDFDTGNGPVEAFPATLPDLVTLWKLTAVPNIRTFVHTLGGYPTGDLALLPDGPTPEERENNPYQVSLTATAEDGRISRAVLHSVNGYMFTALASVEAADLVLHGEHREGF